MKRRALKRVTSADALQTLPDIERLDLTKPSLPNRHDLFICALGFESRCLSVPEAIAATGTVRVSKAIVLNYDTNRKDNERNESKLKDALTGFADEVQPIEADDPEFPEPLRKALRTPPDATGRPWRVIFDLSVCSSKFILTVMRVLKEARVELFVTYTEAKEYRPTQDEARALREGSKHPREGHLSVEPGDVFASREHPGNNLEELPEVVIAFVTYDADRTSAVIAKVDQSILDQPDRVVWVIGEPHLVKDHWRAEHVREINVPKDSPFVETVTTFDYRETVRLLCRVAEQHGRKRHLTISPLGSKMQSLGIAIFHYIHPETSIYFVKPKEYVAEDYSKEHRDLWMIPFGSLSTHLEELDRIGEFSLVDL